MFRYKKAIFDFYFNFFLMLIALFQKNPNKGGGRGGSVISKGKVINVKIPGVFSKPYPVLKQYPPSPPCLDFL